MYAKEKNAAWNKINKIFILYSQGKHIYCKYYNVRTKKQKGGIAMIKASNKLKNYMCSALIGGMLLSFGGVAYATETEKSSSVQNLNSITPCPKNHHNKCNPEKMKERLQAKLAPLVESGELSQQKADKIVEYYYKVSLERKALWKKAKAMNPEERKEYITKIKKERKRPLVELVNDKIITQQEADNIRKVMPKKGHYHKKTQ